MSDPGSTYSAPWYRHRWPWLLMAGPFVVIVASFVTLWLAIVSNDGLVAEDYYKRGLAINQTLRHDERAVALGLEARVSVTSERITIGLRARDPGFRFPPALRATMSHPTRAGLDQTMLLPRREGEYSAEYHLPSAGRWLVLIEDDAGTWRLLGGIMLPALEESVIGGKS